MLRVITTGLRRINRKSSTYFFKQLVDTGNMNYSTKIEYPTPRRDENVVDDYHGTKIQDPYRWMEDPDSEETKKFVEVQNAIATPFLEQCPVREEIHKCLTKLWDYPRYGCPFRRGEKYYFFQNAGLQNQSVLYVQDTLHSEPKVFLDPNELSKDGTISLQTYSFSEDDQVFAYGLSSKGSDWFTVHFKHVEKGDIYPETLEKVKFTGISWTHDNKGIFYGCFRDQEGKTDGSEPDRNKNYKLLYHFLGTPQSEDIVVVDFPDEPDYLIGSCVSSCGRYLIVTPQKTVKDNLVYFSDLDATNRQITGKLELVPVVTKLEADYDYVTNTGSVCVFKTNKDAPNCKLITIDFANPEPAAWKTLVPDHDSDVLDWVKVVNEKFLVLCYIRDVKNVLHLHSLDTGEYITSFPLDLGTITGFSGRKKYKDIFYQFSSLLTPGIIYHCDLSQPQIKPTLFRETKLTNFDREKFTTQQIFYESKDGTKIPMFIVHKKDLVKNGNNFCLLYGYGGFNVSILPSFRVSCVAVINHFDGIFVLANIRGGGEYGEKWHKAGRMENKQNVFDDFQAAAEYLIRENYTTSKLLTIEGGSNGGLLVAACANQRPDLYGAVIANVGVLDMLRFHKFTIGHHWVSDYGSAENKNDFEVLLKYSPLHNIKIPENGTTQYPAILLLTADHDDRVVPLHSLKFIATLQHTFKNHPLQKNPLLIKIDTNAGHGGGKPTTKLIKEWTDVFSFLVNTLRLKFHP